MVKIYVRKINSLLEDGTLQMKDVESYIDDNVPTRWRDEVKSYFMNGE